MIILAPDSFKGSLSALQASEVLAGGIRSVKPDVKIRQLPIADGGEGTLDILLSARSGQRLEESVAGACFQPMRVTYGTISNKDGTQTAVIEIAKIIGLSQFRHTPVEQRSSAGVGELVRKCLDRGIRSFLIGLGGSATNDGGAGVLAALGVKLLDGQGHEVTPTPFGLSDVRRVDFSSLDPRLTESDIQVLSDVANSLLGPDGATVMYGPQKGVQAGKIPEFERYIRCFSNLCDLQVGQDISGRKGTGAAGGIGYAFQLLGARHQSGAEVIFDIYGLDDLLKDASWLITGEGETNVQTLYGKAPIVAARHARYCHVPAVLISGSIDPDCVPKINEWFDELIEIRHASMTLRESMLLARKLLADAASQFARKHLLD